MRNTNRDSLKETHVLLTQVAIADYRDAFISLLLNRVPQLKVQVGESYFEQSTRTSSFVKSMPSTQTIKNHFFLFRKLCWQSICWKSALGVDVYIGELNPRLLTTWVLLGIRKLQGKRSVLWGHAWARSGKHSKTEPLRHLMRMLADGLILYTHSQRNELVERYPEFSKKCFVAPNSLYSHQLMKQSKSEEIPTDFIYVGRMIPSKKVSLLVDAFALFSKDHVDSKLHLVGDGEELLRLREHAHRMSIKNIIFHGHVSSHNLLEDIYSRSVAAVSPGYIGLSITQSFSFGKPMIISKDEPHSPEIEAFKEGLNGSFFKTDDPLSLSVQMEQWYQRRNELDKISTTIIDDCRSSYSVECMVDGFCKAIQA